MTCWSSSLPREGHAADELTPFAPTFEKKTTQAVMICAMVSLRALALVQLSTSWRVHVRHCDVCIAHVYRTPVPFNVCLEGGWGPS